MNQHIASILERAAREAFSCTPEMSRAIQHSPAKRLGRLVLVGLARQYPDAWNKLYDQTLVAPGYHYVASGSEHTVVTDSREVIKIDRGSRDMSESDRRVRLRELQALYQHSWRYLNDFLLPQTITIDQVPLKNRATAVLTPQPFIRPAVPNLTWQPVSSIVERLDQAAIPRQRIADQLHRFCEQSSVMLECEGLGADIGGTGNVVITSQGNIRLVDSYPTLPALRARPSLIAGCASIDEEHTMVMQDFVMLADELGSHSQTVVMA